MARNQSFFYSRTRRPFHREKGYPKKWITEQTNRNKKCHIASSDFTSARIEQKSSGGRQNRPKRGHPLRPSSHTSPTTPTAPRRRAESPRRMIPAKLAWNYFHAGRRRRSGGREISGLRIGRQRRFHPRDINTKRTPRREREREGQIGTNLQFPRPIGRSCDPEPNAERPPPPSQPRVRPSFPCHRKVWLNRPVDCWCRLVSLLFSLLVLGRVLSITVLVQLFAFHGPISRRRSTAATESIRAVRQQRNIRTNLIDVVNKSISTKSSEQFSLSTGPLVPT